MWKKIVDFVKSIWVKYFDAEVKAFIAAEKQALEKDIADLKAAVVPVAAEKVAEEKQKLVDTINSKREDFKKKIQEAILKKLS